MMKYLRGTREEVFSHPWEGLTMSIDKRSKYTDKYLQYYSAKNIIPFDNV